MLLYKSSWKRHEAFSSPSINGLIVGQSVLLTFNKTINLEEKTLKSKPGCIGRVNPPHKNILATETTVASQIWSGYCPMLLKKV